VFFVIYLQSMVDTICETRVGFLKNTNFPVPQRNRGFRKLAHELRQDFYSQKARTSHEILARTSCASIYSKKARTSHEILARTSCASIYSQKARSSF
jgi:hypothetical protein